MNVPKNLDKSEQRGAALRLLRLVSRLPKMLQGGLDKAEREEIAVELLGIAGALAVDVVD